MFVICLIANVKIQSNSKYYLKYIVAYKYLRNSLNTCGPYFDYAFTCILMLPVVTEAERETESGWGSHDDVTMPSSKHETSSTRLPYTRWEAIAEDDEERASPSPVEFHRFEEDRRSDGSNSRSKPSLSAIFSPRGRKHSPTNNNSIAVVSSPVIARSRQLHQDSWCWRNATKILGIKQLMVEV